MQGRRARRQNQPLLPLRTRHIPNTISFWYCDFKITAFNQPLFRFGQRHARCLRAWFSMGIGFSLAAMLGVTMICAWESVTALHLLNGNIEFSKSWSAFLFGFPPSVPKLGISLADAGYICLSSFISVAFHEFGHAVAAARGGQWGSYVVNI